MLELKIGDRVKLTAKASEDYSTLIHEHNNEPGTVVEIECEKKYPHIDKPSVKVKFDNGRSPNATPCWYNECLEPVEETLRKVRIRALLAELAEVL